MRSITGLHRQPAAADVVRSSDWYERVLGFVPILMEEDEDVVTMIVMEQGRPDLMGSAPAGRGRL
jgi:hypothetical protein